ncbi:hypothetical protein [Companilactobacillus nodensis]|nr:hypothetical protein [Companilactobacillus nodensis]
MKHKRVLTQIGFALFGVLSIILMFLYFDKPEEAQAFVYSDQSVLDVAPGGLPLGDYFTRNEGKTFSTGDTNSAVVHNISSKNVDAVQLTSGSNQTGAVWSTGKNYFDVTKKQTMSMWMYFGLNPDKDNMAGMAFVLQNDPRGNNAISTYNGHVNSGETLGVWGSEGKRTSSIGSTTYFGGLEDLGDDPLYQTTQKQAIQNSFAIEFDSKVNNGGLGKGTFNNWKYADVQTNDMVPSNGDGFDWWPYNDAENNSLSHPHIAWNYPAVKDTYRQVGVNPPHKTFLVGVSGTSILSMKHNLGSDGGHNGADAELTVNGNDMPTDGWRHLTIEYTPPDEGSTIGQLTYKYRDKNYDGTPTDPDDKIKGPKEIFATANIDLKNFHLDPGQTKIQYGFTAATGGTPITNAVIFESIPSLVNATSDAQIFDTTAVKKLLPGDTVAGQDDLNIQYNLNYIDGEEDLSNITLTAPKLSNVTYQKIDGHYGEVNYYDDNDKLADTEYIDDLGDDPYSIKLSKPLNDDSDDIYRNAKVVLHAQANEVKEDTLVAETTAKYDGDFYKDNFQTPKFTIKKTTYVPTITPDEGTQNQTVPIDGQISIGGTVTRVKQGSKDELSEFKDTDMSIYVNIDNTTYQPIGTLQDDDISTSGHFTIANDKMGLDIKEHTIAVRAMYSDGEMSEEVVYKVNVVKVALMIHATDNQKSIKVKDLDNVLLDGTVAYSNNQLMEENPPQTPEDNRHWNVHMVINNLDDGFHMEATQMKTDIGGSTTDTYSGKLAPGFGTSDKQAYIHTGVNVIDLSVVDPDGMVSNTLTYTVTVPKRNPILSPDNQTIEVVNGDDMIELPAHVTYNDDEANDYKFNTGRLQWMMSYEGSGDPQASFIQARDSDGKIINDASELDFVQKYSKDKLGIDPVDADGNKTETKNGHTVDVYLRDGYGRESNKITYTFNFVRRSAILKYSDDYAFETINQSPEERMVRRKGEWHLSVDTVDSGYILSAEAGDMVSTAPVPKINLAGQMVYVDPNSGNLKTMDNLVRLASDSDITSGSHPIDWDDNNGILLQVDANAQAGNYQGSISWNLTESIK